MSKIEVNTVDVQSGSTLTIGSSGKTVALASGASQTGFGPTGGISWQTSIKTTDFTAASNEGYFVNTSGGSDITVTLPSSPSSGNVVAIKDYARTFGTNKVILGRNGSNMDGNAANSNLETDGQSVILVFMDSTKGWSLINEDTTSALGAAFITATGGNTVATCGNFKIHTFTGPGTFQVTCAGNAGGSNTLEYLVVAGGGGGGAGGSGGGGGGAGGYRESSGATAGAYSRSPLGACVSGLTASVASFPITVGGGGTPSTPPGAGGSGANSIFSTITSAGGGGGADGGNAALAGGSGGGGGFRPPNPISQGAAGNTPSVSPPQGNPGGNTNASTSNPDRGGGGGGATVAGTTPSGNSAGPGGAGATSSINGTPTARAGGGGGGKDEDSPNGGTSGDGGSGGGGRGASSDASNPRTVESGTANTGGGGGGGGAGGPSPHPASGAGGSGIVIIRYKFQ
tara:strand:+ start:366 stop:1733 length:1368 start_codon:yes stop_codon:yes gene_type:complete